MEIWGEGEVTSYDLKNLHVHLNTLRRTIGLLAPNVLSLRGVGYAFVDPLPPFTDNTDRLAFLVDLPVL